MKLWTHKKLRTNIIALFFLISTFAFGQSPAPDTSGLSPHTIAMYNGLFEKEWSRKFVDEWNAIPDSARVLKGMGAVRFVSVGAESVSTIMSFDSTGKAWLPGSGGVFLMTADSIPTFTAKLEKWAEFMEGKFNAVAGVLTKKISYKGPFTLAIKYGFQFNKVAPVGKRIAEALHKK
ncbi:MAG TPA: hypothetical protein VL633_12895 [Bacteroidota bacterium]|nr:hypothetical protein [Bacteroidota bacterium]